MKIVELIPGKVPAEKISLIKRIFKDECLYKVEDIFENADFLTKESLKLKGIPLGLAKVIDVAVRELQLKQQQIT
jgi:hypothetical protein